MKLKESEREEQKGGKQPEERWKGGGLGRGFQEGQGEQGCFKGGEKERETGDLRVAERKGERERETKRK